VARARDPDYSNEGGIVLGVLDDFPYRSGATRLDPGDLLVVYSDGVTAPGNRAAD
jgi:serine phosphatase RsbU (regulator of sigma subunit)